MAHRITAELPGVLSRPFRPNVRRCVQVVCIFALGSWLSVYLVITGSVKAGNVLGY